MGTAGNRTGYKCFSINTTVRNPKRYMDFLSVFESDFDGLIFTNETKERFYIELLKSGVYKPLNSSLRILDKYDNKESLSDSEVKYLIDNNKQATGNSGRVITQLRALKDIGFLKFEGSKKKYSISITKLGRELLESKNVQDVYSKALVGLHAFNPGRLSILNKSRPFLNTLFVIDGINSHQINSNLKASGITRYEFGVFVLTMKDCNYKKTIDLILNYRKIHRFTENEFFAKNFLDSMGLLNMSYKNYIVEYPDEVFRKFEMTGLFIRNRFNFINTNEYESKKLSYLLANYKDYVFNNFLDLDEYNDFLFSIHLPWQTQLKLDEIKESKIEYIRSISRDKPLIVSESIADVYQIDRLYYKNSLVNLLEKKNIALNEITNDIKALAVGSDNFLIKKLKEVGDPLKLEWLISALMIIKYPDLSIVPNMILDLEGFPISYAPGGLADIEIKGESVFGTIEVTMIRNRNQQLNSETTSIVRHLLNSKENERFTFSILVAPYIHQDTIRYFKFESIQNNIPILPLNILKFLDFINGSNDFLEFNSNVNFLNRILTQLSIDDYQNHIIT